MSKTIFISSTYKDLILHREQIWKTLQNFDLKITGMEAFGARRSNPLETCLTEINSSDIYLGVISMCYGSVDDFSGKSFTQIEYEKAHELGLETLIFLVNESSGSVTTGNIDFGDKQLRLNAFKNILKKNHTVDFFKNETDLGRKVFTSLEKLVPSPGQIRSRPFELETKVKKILLNKEWWILFIGYLNGKPLEVMTCRWDPEDGILLPNFVENGIMVFRKEEGVNYYDFSYQNKRGYKTTIEGVNYLFDFQINTYDKIITKLLQSDVHLSVVINTINDMKLENKNYDNWNSNLIKALTEN